MARCSPNVLGDDDEELDTASFMLEACGIEYSDFYNNERILTRENLERHFPSLRKMIDMRSFRRAPYFVIGYFILVTGVEMPEGLRHEILNSAKWKHEADGYWLEKNAEVERKICLKDFRLKIRAHKRSRTVIGLSEFEKKCKSGRIYDAKHLLLDGWGLKTIPKPVFKIKGLETLCLSANELQSIPPEISNLKALKILNLYYNQLTNLPNSIGELSSLESLSIANNRISSLPSSMRHLKHLKYISVGGTQITKIPEFLKAKRLDEYSETIYL